MRTSTLQAPGDRAVRRVAAVAVRRRYVPRRHRDRGTAALFRRLLCDDRTVARKFLRAGASRRRNCWRAIRPARSFGTSLVRRARCGSRSVAVSPTACSRSIRKSTATTAASASASCRAIRSMRIAGIDSAAIRAAWLDQVGGHLIFGLPVTLLLFSALWVALRRTKRLHDEARAPRIRRRRAAPGAAARSHRATDRRRRPRLQQSADDRQRHGAAAAPSRQRREGDPAPRRHRQCDRARRKPHPAIARLLAAAGAPAERDRSRRAAAGDQGHAQPLAARRHRYPAWRAAAAVRGEGRPQRVRARFAQSRVQRARRHALRRHADHQRQADGAARPGHGGRVERRLRRGAGGRYRHRHSAGGLAAGVRAVLHHQGASARAPA